MTPERWNRLKDLFDAALDLPVSRRAAYVARVREGDEETSQPTMLDIGQPAPDRNVSWPRRDG